MAWGKGKKQKKSAEPKDAKDDLERDAGAERGSAAESQDGTEADEGSQEESSGNAGDAGEVSDSTPERERDHESDPEGDGGSEKAVGFDTSDPTNPSADEIPDSKEPSNPSSDDDSSLKEDAAARNKEKTVVEENKVIGEICEGLENAIVAQANMGELAAVLRKMMDAAPPEDDEDAVKAWKKQVKTQKNLLRAKMIEWDVAYKDMKEALRKIK